jgi:hypothetical protein
MAFKEEEYLELLQGIRKTVWGAGLGSIDEQIMSRFKGSEGPFYDLTMYLRLLIENMSLGSVFQLRADLYRIQEITETESGHSIEGFQLQFTPEEARLYKTESIDFVPMPASQKVIEELRSVLEELYSDWENRFNKG